LVLDFGGQYSQLIARRVRECGVFAELLPHHVGLEEVTRRQPRGLILSGGPASVYADGAPALRPELLELGIPVSQPVTLKTEADRAELASWRPDVLVVVAYGLILPRAVLELPRLGCVNIHASLLPRWRGAAPIQRAILAGDMESGVSIMRMDVGLDTGPVFLERKVAISPHDTGGSLHDRLAALGASAVVEVLDQLAEDRAVSTPQREDGLTYASKIDKAEALIDWTRPAVEIERQVRAFNPWPVAETRLEGEQLRIYAHLLGSPLSVARTPYELQTTLESATVPVLVDTAGRSHTDEGAEDMLRVVATRSDVRTHLVLAADTPLPTLQKVVDRFATANPSRVVLTKVDEAGSLASLVSFLRERQLRLSYLGTGQRVPDDLQIATPRVFAGWVAGDTSARGAAA